MIDAQAVIRAVNRVEAALELLRETYISGSRPGGRKAKNAAPPAPLDLGKLDLIQTIEKSLSGHCQMIEEETGDPIGDDWAVYVRHHADFVSAQYWALDCVDEFNSDASKAEVMCGVRERRVSLDDPCECGAKRYAYSEELVVLCANGHAQKAAQFITPGTLVTVRNAEKSLGVRNGRVGQMVRDGMIENHGSVARPLVDLEIVRQVLT